MFRERGIAASTLADVAAHAGLTKGAVYSSFSSKDELVLTVMEQQILERHVAALTAVSDAPDFGVALERAGEILFGALRADEGWHRALAEYFALSRHDPALAEGLRRSRAESRRLTEEALRDVLAALGVQPPMPLPQLTLAIFALSNGLGIEMGIDADAPGDGVFTQVLALVFGEALDRRASD